MALAGNGYCGTTKRFEHTAERGKPRHRFSGRWTLPACFILDTDILGMAIPSCILRGTCPSEALLYFQRSRRHSQRSTGDMLQQQRHRMSLLFAVAVLHRCNCKVLEEVHSSTMYWYLLFGVHSRYILDSTLYIIYSICCSWAQDYSNDSFVLDHSWTRSSYLDA